MLYIEIMHILYMYTFNTDSFFEFQEHGIKPRHILSRGVGGGKLYTTPSDFRLWSPISIFECASKMEIRVKIGSQPVLFGGYIFTWTQRLGHFTGSDEVVRFVRITAFRGCTHARGRQRHKCQPLWFLEGALGLAAVMASVSQYWAALALAVKDSGQGVAVEELRKAHDIACRHLNSIN